MRSLVHDIPVSPEGGTGQDVYGIVRSEISRERGHGVIVIEGGTVLTVDDAGHVYAPGHVALDGDRIVAVWPGCYDRTDGVEAPRSVQRIDASGLVVMPGLVDLHYHTAIGKGYC